MNGALLALVVAGAGGAGAVCRFVTDGTIARRVFLGFPLGTLVVNLIGSLILGIVTGLALHHGLSAEVRRIVGVGFCGGLTTWSTASFEIVRLREERSLSVAASYALGSLAGSVLAGAAGLLLVAR